MGVIASMVWTVLWTNGYIVLAALALLCITFPLLAAAYVAHKFMYRVSSTVVTGNYGAADANNSNEFEVESDLNQSIPSFLINSRGIQSLLRGFVLNGIWYDTVS